MKTILKLNEISPVADGIFEGKYNYTKTADAPDGIMVRSYKMHDYAVSDNLLAVARAGAGVNNIPVADYTKRGIVVFNTPGANANAVKELVIASLLLSSRKIVDGISWANTLTGNEDVAKAVEQGKSAFVGPELYGKKFGVIGLGAIGALVANAAVNLGMEVYGYDPYISIDQAWGLSRAVKHVTDFNELLKTCDYVTLHIPYMESTKNTINKDNIKLMKKGVRIINLARGELIDSDAILEATQSGLVSCYVTDFPSAKLINRENIVCIPHLGASTPEAEDNCAVAAAKELVDYIENGNIKNSVNFKNAVLPRMGVARLAIIHMNVKNTLSQFTTIIGNNNVNIANMLNTSSGDFAYTVFDLDSEVSSSMFDEFKALEGVIKIRIL